MDDGFEQRALPPNGEDGDGVPRRIGRRLAELRFLSPCFFGFAFARAYYDVAAARCAGLFPGNAWWGQDLIVIGMVPAFVLCVLAARRVLPLWRQPFALPLATVCLVAGPVLFAAGGWFPQASTVLGAAGTVAAGLGIGLSILLWAELQSCFNSFQIVLYVAGAFFLGSLIGWFVLGLTGLRLFAALVALALMSAACLVVGFAKVRPADKPKGFSGSLQFPWKLVVALGVYEFVLGVRQAAVSFAGETLTLGVLLAAAALFVLVYFFSHRFDFTYVYRTPFVLMSCGLLVTFVSFSSQSAAADLLVSVGYALMFLLLTILLCDIAHRWRVSAALLCSIEELVMLTSLGGHALTAAGERGALPFAADSPAAFVALAILVIVASMALLTEREYSRWGLALFGMGELAAGGDHDALARRCAELSARFGLSPREKEVFQLLAEDRSAAEIERELCIASGTLKSHTRRIYRKLDIHRREELRALVEGSEKE